MLQWLKMWQVKTLLFIQVFQILTAKIQLMLKYLQTICKVQKIQKLKKLISTLKKLQLTQPKQTKGKIWLLT